MATPRSLRGKGRRGPAQEENDGPNEGTMVANPQAVPLLFGSTSEVAAISQRGVLGAVLF